MNEFYGLVGDRLGAVNESGRRPVDMWSEKPLRAFIHLPPCRKEHVGLLLVFLRGSVRLMAVLVQHPGAHPFLASRYQISGLWFVVLAMSTVGDVPGGAWKMVYQ